MRLLEVLKKPSYGAIALVSSLALLAVYAYTQNLGIIENIPFWFSIIPWYNLILLPIFLVLFGALVAYQVYLWKSPKSCGVGKKVKGFSLGGVATTGGFLVAQCPACASLVTLLLPISAASVFITYNWAINIISIALLVFALNYLGAFRE